MESSTWDSLEVRPHENKPIIKWTQLGESHTLTFVSEKPREFISKFKSQNDEEKISWAFDVKEDGVDKVIFVSAFSLKLGLKKQAPLQNKTLVITRVLKNGKNLYEVNVLGESSQDFKYIDDDVQKMLDEMREEAKKILESPAGKRGSKLKIKVFKPTEKELEVFDAIATGRIK